jgi:hypothetical protein
MNKKNNFNFAKKFASVMCFFIFFLMFSVTLKAQGNYVDSDVALDRLKQNGSIIKTLRGNNTPNSHTYYVLNKKLDYTVIIYTAIQEGTNVDQALTDAEKIAQSYTLTIDATPDKLTKAEFQDLVQEFQILLSR